MMDFNMTALLTAASSEASEAAQTAAASSGSGKLVLVAIIFLLAGAAAFISVRGKNKTSHSKAEGLPTEILKRTYKSVQKPGRIEHSAQLISKYTLLELDASGETVAEFDLPDLDTEAVPIYGYINVTSSQGLAEPKPACVKNIKLRPLFSDGVDVAANLPATRALVIFKGKDGNIYVRPGEECRKNAEWFAYTGTGHARKAYLNKQPIEDMLGKIIVIGGLLLQIVPNDHGGTVILGGKPKQDDAGAPEQEKAKKDPTGGIAALDQD